MNKRGKTVDKTFLSLDTAEERGFIHRDYIAHCLRWTHVIKRLNERKGWASARILDVGCGREMPLAKMLYSSRYTVQQYYGVDVGPIEDSAMAVFDSGKFPIKVWENTDLLQINLEDLDEQEVNWATCFEVIEHVEPAHMIAMLSHVKSLLAPDGTFFLSTPCWDRVNCADNHVNEMTYEALGAVLCGLDFSVEKVYGTFASIKDYAHLLRPEMQTLFDSLRGYYDTNMLSCIFAPLFPAQSRNCIWELRHSVTGKEGIQFKPLEECQTPWGSSSKWEEMAV